MAVSTHDQVLREADRLAGRALRQAAKGYKQKTLGPLMEALRAGKSLASTARLLSAALVTRMATGPEAMALAQTAVQAALIAQTAATPKGLDKQRETR